MGRRLEFGGRSSPPLQEDQSEPEMTEEEKEFQLVCSHTFLSRHISYTLLKHLCFSTGPICSLQMLMTKTLLTEVLLEVTNEEIFLVAKETHRKATKGLLLFPSVRATVPSSLILRKSHISTEIRLGYVLTDKYEAFLSD